MKYNGYLIEEENTGIAPKNAKFYFHIIDEEIICGYGENAEDCQKQIDELNLNEIKDILEDEFGWGNLDCEEHKWFVDGLIKDVVSICNRSETCH